MSTVLDIGQRTLPELAATANREHELVIEAGTSMVEHAIRAGEALLAAKAECPPGSWTNWREANTGFGLTTAALYMRMARYQDRLNGEVASIGQAKRLLAAEEVPNMSRGHQRYPPHIRDAARDMRDSGMTFAAIERELGVSSRTLRMWMDRSQYDRWKQSTRRAQARRMAADKALARAEREQQITRAVRKAGAAIAEAWAMAERMQDVLAQAQNEAIDSEAKRALSEAGVHYRKMRDEIVCALGVA